MIHKNPRTNLTRTFICIDFPDEVIKEIARLQSLLEKKFVGKFTELENLHLTLKFLGEILQEKLDKVKSFLSSISLPKFEAHLHNIGLFSYRHNPRIIWIKIAGKPIFDLQAKIDEVLSPLFPKEERFMSHLTIARVKHVPDKRYFYDYIKNINVKKIKFSVNSFKLKFSNLQPLGPVYTTLEEYELKESLH